MRDDDEEDFGGDAEYHPEAEDAGTFKCPACSTEIYGDSPRCPSCGDYVTPGARSGAKSMPRWVWVVTVVMILALVGGALRAC
jgi:hypothetical protein